MENLSAEVDQIQIVALFETLKIPLRIYQLDNKVDQVRVFQIPEQQTNGQDDYVELLYQPGHYNLIY